MGPTHSGARLAPAELYDALSNDRRRAVLQCLGAEEDGMSVRELADAVASETSEDAEGTAKSIYISLIQIHLPKLADYEIITYDEAEKLVAPGPALGQSNACLTAHASDGESKLRDRLPPLLFGVSFVALALALSGVTPTRFLLGVALVVQLVGLLAAMDATLQTAILERLLR